MFVATTDTGSVTWDNGALTGDADLVRTVQDALGGSVIFNYWGERDASLDDEFTAYLTVGYALGPDVTIEPIPDNPDGYEEEGVWPDVGASVLASALERHKQA